MGRFRLKNIEENRTIIKDSITNNDGTDSLINADKITVSNDSRHKDFFMSREELMILNSNLILSKLKLGEKPNIILPVEDSITDSLLFILSKFQPTQTFKGIVELCEVVIATDSDFINIFHTVIENIIPGSFFKYRMPLNANEEYWVKARYKLRDSEIVHFTEWSDPVNFRTDNSLITYPAPTITINGDPNDLPYLSTLAATFSFSNVKLEWKILDSTGTITDIIIEENANSPANLLITPELFDSNNSYTVLASYTYNNNISLSDSVSFTIENTLLRGLNTDIVSLPISLAHHGQSTTNENNIVVTGGVSTTGITNKLFIYFKDFNTWIEGAAMPFAVHSHKQATIDNKIFLFGGENQSALPYLQIYDLNNNTWSMGLNLPINIKDFSMSVSNKKIIITGGNKLVSLNPLIYTKSIKTLIYDTETNNWHYGPDLDAGVSNHLQFTTHDGNVIISGGMDVNGNIINTTKKIFIDTPNSNPVLINPAPIRFMDPMVSFDTTGNPAILGLKEYINNNLEVSKSVYTLKFDGNSTVTWSLFQNEISEFTIGAESSNVDSLSSITETSLILFTGGFRDPGNNSIIENILNITNKATVF